MFSHLNILVWKWSKIAVQDKVNFLADFALQNMVEITLLDGLKPLVERRIANFNIFLDFLGFLRFG